MPSRHCEKGLQKSQVKWQIPPLLPEPPWPPQPDGGMTIAAQRTRILLGVEEERNLEQESLTSQLTSTSKLQATHPSMSDSNDESMLFAAPGHRILTDLIEERTLAEKSLTSQSTAAPKVQAKHSSFSDGDLRGSPWKPLKQDAPEESDDPDAVEWEPPKLAENVDLGKTIADCEGSV